MTRWGTQASFASVDPSEAEAEIEARAIEELRSRIEKTQSQVRRIHPDLETGLAVWKGLSVEISKGGFAYTWLR